MSESGRGASGILGVSVGIGLVLAGWFVGWEFFPTVDAGTIRLHVNAPAGTRIEDTGVIFSRVEEEIRKVVETDDLDVIIDNVGIPPSTNLAYSDNITLTSSDGEILVSLKPHHRVPTGEYVRRLREILPERFPDCAFYFQPGDMMNQILPKQQRGGRCGMCLCWTVRIRWERWDSGWWPRSRRSAG